MYCNYCGKQMPESYSYEVGGVVECSKCFRIWMSTVRERTTTPEEKLHARIADLEKELAESDDLIEFTRENQLMPYADFEDLEQDWDRNHKEKRLKANRDRSPGPVERTDRGQKQTISGGK